MADGGKVDAGWADAAAVRVQVLGAVRAWRGDEELKLGAPKQRAVLGMLALRRNDVVSRGELIDGVWGEAAPASAANGVHVYVSELRRLLEPSAGRRAPAGVLVACSPGYLLRLGPGQLDAEVLRGYLTRARRSRAAGDLSAAARLLEAAFRLRRAPVLSGVPGPWAEVERIRLEEELLTATEEHGDLLLTLGRHVELTGRLSELVREHPFRERFHGQLMLALYRSGRQADALARFAETRRTLIDELGVEPGDELRLLHTRILEADPVLALPAGGVELAPGSSDHDRPSPGSTARSAREGGTAVRRELPASVRAFTGRSGELAELDRLLDAGPPRRAESQEPSTAAEPTDAGPDAAAIVVITGTAGVGKTALAVHWAHRVADVFPDGQLYLDLRGYHEGEPLDTLDALDMLLRSLGVSDADIPVGVDECAARLRTLAAGRRMVFVLDNARTAEQVRPLLPGSAASRVVVTSRNDLAGLVARDGAQRIELDPLSRPEAVALLGTLIGARADAEPDAAALLAEQCARLPLALRVAAEIAQSRASTPLRDLCADLSSRQRRLDVLDASGDTGSAVRAVFDWSYRHLPPATARTFALLGLHPGHDMTVTAVAALTGADCADATHFETRRHLADLARAHLLQPVARLRYGMHDLLRVYAAERAERDLSPDDREAAASRLFDYYRYAAVLAVQALFPHEAGAAAGLGPTTVSAYAGRPSGSAAALDWLDRERRNLVAVCGYAGRHGWPGYCADLSRILGPYLDAHAHYRDGVSVHGEALNACADRPDDEADVLLNLSAAHYRLGQAHKALPLARRALVLHAERSDYRGQSRALGNLGLIYRYLGRYTEALEHHRRALALHRATGNRRREAMQLANLGLLYERLGEYRQAARFQSAAAAVFGELGDRRSEASALANLALVHARRGECDAAVGVLTDTLAVARRFGDRNEEAEQLVTLGYVKRLLGRYPQALNHLDQAYLLSLDIGRPLLQAQVLNALGQAHRATGALESALSSHREALVLARRLGERYEQARALEGLADLLDASGDPAGARRTWAGALAIYADLHVPEAHDVAERLQRCAVGPVSHGPCTLQCAQ